MSYMYRNFQHADIGGKRLAYRVILLLKRVVVGHFKDLSINRTWIYDLEEFTFLFKRMASRPRGRSVSSTSYITVAPVGKGLRN